MTVSTVAVCCDDLGLMGDARRLCAVAGLEVEVTGSHDARRWWSAASAVLLDPVAAAQLAAARVPRRRRVALLARTDDPADWRLAVALGAEQVVVVPRDERSLLDGVLAVGEGGDGAPVVLCVPATGGAGASTVAAGLALASARRGAGTVLVDADPDGGGLDLLFGLERTQAVRWPDVLGPGAPPTPESLPDGLLQPAPDLALLSCSRDDDQQSGAASAWPAVLPAARSTYGLVVVDLPRSVRLDERRVADVVLLVVHAGVRQTVAAAAAARRLRGHCADVRLVVRGSSHGGLDAADVAAAVGVPLAAQIPADRRIPVAADEGRLARLLPRLPFDRLADDLTSVRRPAA